jgi:hypothetical protein
VNGRLRSLVVLGALVLATLALAGCGSASKSSSSSRQGSSQGQGGGSVATSPAVSPSANEQDADGDNDTLAAGRYDIDHDAQPSYGSAADARDRQLITVLIERFYARAAAGDGRGACALLYGLVAETVVEEHNHGKGPRSLRGDTCAQVAGKLFAQNHRERVEDLAALRVTLVQVRGNHGWAVLDLGSKGEDLALLRREDGGWHMDELKDEVL